MKVDFRSFNFDKNINTTEIIKGAFTLIGAIIVFVSITWVQMEISVKEIQLELAREFQQLMPMLRNNYTNQVSKDGRHIEIRVVLRIESTLPTYVFPPIISLLNSEGEEVLKEKYMIKDVNQFHGIFSPDSEYKITYNIEMEEGVDLSDLNLRMAFQTDLPESIKSVYSDVYDDVPDSQWENAYKAWSVEYKYNEKLYAFGQNPIWSTFWENPR